jgi:energy-coupling factor transporter ATP-binding protein EcfA2
VGGLRAAGKTVVGVTHDMDVAAGWFDRVVVLRAGEIVLDGVPETVFAPEHGELLASAGLRPPIAARIGAALGLTPVPRDPGELLRALAVTPAP